MIISHDIKEADWPKMVKKYADFITHNGGKIAHENIWGVRRLSYRIQRQEFGVYATLLFELSATHLAELKQELNLDPQMLRYIVISLTKEKLDYNDVSNFPAPQSASRLAPREEVVVEEPAPKPKRKTTKAEEAVEAPAEEAVTDLASGQGPAEGGGEATAEAPIAEGTVTEEAPTEETNKEA
jgi:small subunit ribosomal protein S6